MILRPASTKRKPKTEAVSDDRRRQVSYAHAYILRRGCREIRITKVTPRLTSDGNKG